MAFKKRLTGKMGDKKDKKGGGGNKKKTGTSFRVSPGGGEGTFGGFSGGFRVGGGVGMVGPGKDLPPPTHKRTELPKQKQGFVPNPKLNPRRGNR